MLFHFEYINNYSESFVKMKILGIKIRFKHYIYKTIGKLKKESITFINYLAVKNIGDKFSSPTLYFNFNDYLYADHLAVINQKVKLTDTIIIGGGVFLKPFLMKYIEDLNKKIICWGIGLFQHEKLDFKNFKLIGLRDFNREEINNINVFYCPCVSCMNTIFDKNFTIKNEVVAYLHKIKTTEEDYKNLHNIPFKTNEDNFQEVINFLGTANYIVTNSYHGVYWGTLLGKKVIAIPYNSKFYGFKYPPVYATFTNWQEKMNEAKDYPEALNDARNSNIEFYKKVKEILNE